MIACASSSPDVRSAIGLPTGAVAVGAGLAEAGDAGDDEARGAGEEDVGTEAEALHASGAEVLDDDVGILRQLHEDGLALGTLEIERQRALVAMQVLEVEAVALAAHRVDVVVGRRLDLDDAGAPVGELARCRRSGAVRGQIEDADVG